MLTYTDPYSADDFSRVAADVAASGAFPCTSILIDRRLATAPTREYVDAVVASMASMAAALEGARGAVVVSDAAGYGMSRMVETLAELHALHRLRVFEDYTAAMAWLDSDDPDD